MFCYFQAEFFAKVCKQSRPSTTKCSNSTKRGANNDSRACKAQGNASGRERGREKAQTDGGVAHGGLCFLVFFGDFSVVLYSSEICLSMSPIRDNRKLPGGNSGEGLSEGALGSMFKEDIYII